MTFREFKEDEKKGQRKKEKKLELHFDSLKNWSSSSRLRKGIRYSIGRGYPSGVKESSDVEGWKGG